MNTCAHNKSTAAAFRSGPLRAYLYILLSFPFLLQSVLTFASESNQELNRAVSGFYNVYLKVRPLGIPQEKEWAKLRPYLSVSLRNQIQAANQAEQQYQKENRGEVPPLIEGDLFSSLFEGATGFHVLECSTKATKGMCSVEFTYLDPRDKSSFKWKDKVYAVREGGRWLLDDIEYLGDWQFMHKGSLKKVLKAVVEENKRK